MSSEQDLYGKGFNDGYMQCSIDNKEKSTGCEYFKKGWCNCDCHPDELPSSEEMDEAKKRFYEFMNDGENIFQLERKLEAAKSVLWMAEKWAEGKTRDMVEFNKAMEVIDG